MKLRHPGARPGETPRDHMNRLVRWYGPPDGMRALAEYVYRLQEQVAALEHRVAELEAGS